MIYFNPRSLAGATVQLKTPSVDTLDFNPRSLAGATALRSDKLHTAYNFNPRSLAGATFSLCTVIVGSLFQSTLPCGSDYC